MNNPKSNTNNDVPEDLLLIEQAESNEIHQFDDVCIYL